MQTGIARLNAATQYFLDACPAVQSWTQLHEQDWCTFTFDESIEVPVVPPGVWFDEDSMDADARAEYEHADENASITLVEQSIRRIAPGEARQALLEILDVEGFGGREYEVRTEAQAESLVRERLEWLHTMTTTATWTDVVREIEDRLGANGSRAVAERMANALRADRRLPWTGRGWDVSWLSAASEDDWLRYLRAADANA